MSTSRSVQVLAVLLSLVAINAGLISSANAAEGLELRPAVTLSGSGCPAGSAEAILSGDTLSITFSSFRASAMRPSVDNKSCNLRVAVSVPTGYNLQPVSVQYIGFANIPSGGSGSLASIATLGARRIGTDVANFGPNYSSTFIRSFNVAAETINACNAPVVSTIGVNTSLTARAVDTPAGQQTTVLLDTLDIQAQKPVLQFKFVYNRC